MPRLVATDSAEGYQSSCNYKALSYLARRKTATASFEFKARGPFWDPELPPNGGWRCPKGSRYGGQITDRFGRNCGGAVRRIVGTLSAAASISRMPGTRKRRRLVGGKPDVVGGRGRLSGGGSTRERVSGAVAERASDGPRKPSADLGEVVEVPKPKRRGSGGLLRKLEGLSKEEQKVFLERLDKGNKVVKKAIRATGLMLRGQDASEPGTSFRIALVEDIVFPLLRKIDLTEKITLDMSDEDLNNLILEKFAEVGDELEKIVEDNLVEFEKRLRSAADGLGFDYGSIDFLLLKNFLNNNSKFDEPIEMFELRLLWDQKLNAIQQFKKPVGVFKTADQKRLDKDFADFKKMSFMEKKIELEKLELEKDKLYNDIYLKMFPGLRGDAKRFSDSANKFTDDKELIQELNELEVRTKLFKNMPEVDPNTPKESFTEAEKEKILPFYHDVPLDPMAKKHFDALEKLITEDSEAFQREIRRAEGGISELFEMPTADTSPLRRGLRDVRKFLIKGTGLEFYLIKPKNSYDGKGEISASKILRDLGFPVLASIPSNLKKGGTPLPDAWFVFPSAKSLFAKNADVDSPPDYNSESDFFDDTKTGFVADTLTFFAERILGLTDRHHNNTIQLNVDGNPFSVPIDLESVEELGLFSGYVDTPILEDLPWPEILASRSFNSAIDGLAPKDVEPLVEQLAESIAHMFSRLRTIVREDPSGVLKGDATQINNARRQLEAWLDYWDNKEKFIRELAEYLQEGVIVNSGDFLPELLERVFGEVFGD